MADVLKNFPITTWYKVVLGIAAPCLFIVLWQDRDTLAIFFGGWCLFGVGQWINHPKRVYKKGDALVTDVSRDASWLGWILEIAGIFTILCAFVRGAGFLPL